VIINGYFHQGKTPYVELLLEIANLHIRRKVSFLIDTGSPITILSERDARKLKIDYSRLKPTNEEIMGLGGFSKTYTLSNVILHFFSKSGMVDIERKELFVYKNVATEEEIINQIPSLLGRDILREFTLTYDEKKNNVSLKK